MTLAAVFVPVAFMPGIAGKFFREFGWTAATAVLFSLLVARLLTPMMAAYQLKPQPQKDFADTAFMRRYLGWVDASLRHRGRTLWVALALFIASLALVPFIPTTFIPFTDLGRSNLSIELPPGTQIEDTVARRRTGARDMLQELPELKQVFTMVGSVLDLGDPGKTGGGETRKATLVLDWGPESERDRDQKTLEREVRARLADLPGAKISFISSEPGEIMQLVLSGDDPAMLEATAAAVERDLRGLDRFGQRVLVGLAAAPGVADRARLRARRGSGRRHRRYRRMPRASPPAATTPSAWRSSISPIVRFRFASASRARPCRIRP